MNDDASAAAVETVLTTYLRSIDGCDREVIAAVWLPSPRVSFIHPRGHARGFDSVVRDFYGQTMEAPFARRTLTIVGTPDITLFAPDAAVVAFDWDFTATWRETGRELHSTGRETHVYGHFAERGWRLVHVHYSGPAKIGDGQGF